MRQTCKALVVVIRKNWDLITWSSCILLLAIAVDLRGASYHKLYYRTKNCLASILSRRLKITLSKPRMTYDMSVGQQLNGSNYLGAEGHICKKDVSSCDVLN